MFYICSHMINIFTFVLYVFCIGSICVIYTYIYGISVLYGLFMFTYVLFMYINFYKCYSSFTCVCRCVMNVYICVTYVYTWYIYIYVLHPHIYICVYIYACLHVAICYMFLNGLMCRCVCVYYVSHVSYVLMRFRNVFICVYMCSICFDTFYTV